MGAYVSDDKKIDVHFIAKGVVWFTREGVYESLSYETIGNRVYIVRRAQDRRIPIGYARQAKLPGFLEWHPLIGDDRPRILRQAVRM